MKKLFILSLFIFKSYALELNHNIECVISASYRTAIQLNDQYQMGNFSTIQLNSSPYIELKSHQLGIIPLIKNEVVSGNIQKISFQNESLLVETVFEVPSCKIRSIIPTKF